VAQQNKINSTPTFAAVLELIATLRGKNGCPWDQKQNPSSMSVYLIEETFELVEAIVSENREEIVEEMGDVLFQILFMMHLFQESGQVSMTEVLEKNLEKMIHRHPHVFGNDTVHSAGEVKQRWREIKKREKASNNHSLMDSVPSGLPAMMRAYRISERAVGAGFEWDDLSGVLEQTESEWKEFKAELNRLEADRQSGKARAEEELGDVLFTLVNVGRMAGLHPERALAASTSKFVRRFKQMEAMAAESGNAIDEVPRDEMEALWQAVKANE
jgi:tetrapyrrole methylase family protein/MazG family protein